MSCLDVPIQTILGTECIGDSLPKIMGNFNTLGDAACDLITKVNTLSTNLGSLSASGSASITSLSSTVDAKFIPKPASASAQQVLTYNGSTATWVASAAPNGSTGPTSAKAWVNFNGNLAGTITPRTQYNVSSVTKTGEGYFTINFTTPLTNANYVILGSAELDNGTNLTSGAMVGTNFTIAPTVNAASIYVISDGGILRDSFYTHVAIFGN